VLPADDAPTAVGLALRSAQERQQEQERPQNRH